MVAERKRVDRLVKRGQHTKGVPPVPPQRGTRVYTLKYKTFNARLNQFVKAGWQCGQQAKNSAQPFYSQAHKMTFALI